MGPLTLATPTIARRAMAILVLTVALLAMLSYPTYYGYISTYLLLPRRGLCFADLDATLLTMALLVLNTALLTY